MWKKAIVTTRKYHEMCQNKRNNPQTIWEHSVTGLQSNQGPQGYKSEILPFFLVCSTKRFPKSDRRPWRRNVWEILCPFLCDFIKAEASVDVGLLKGLWQKLKCMNLEYRKDTKIKKNCKLWEPMKNKIHIYVWQNKRI
jgi:hypothetical protein